MVILITNDDSINAPGIRRLVDTTQDLDCEVFVVAPDLPQSGMASAISVNKPLRITQHEDYRNARMFSVNGTPVDCVKLALHTICPKTPDLLLSGINHGSNSGNSVTYSGTMGAALEGSFNGITSIGYSLLHHSLKADFSMGMPFIEEITKKVIDGGGLPKGVCLNVNIPAMVTPLGIKVCRAACGHWTEEYMRYTDPTGNPFYWLTGRFINDEPNATDTDEYYLSKDYISVVPVTNDLTSYASLDIISKMILG